MNKKYDNQQNDVGKARQATRFIEAARQLGADEDEAAFKAKLAQIARQKLKGDVPEPPDIKPDE